MCGLFLELPGPKLDSFAARDNCRQRHLAACDVTLKDTIMYTDHVSSTVPFTSVIMTSLHRGDMFQPVLCVKLLATALLACCMMVVTSSEGTSSPAPVRLPDMLFNESTMLFDRVVTCNNTTATGNVFPAETWSCYNIRVAEDRLRTCHPASASASTHCDDGDGKNDIGALCRQLLQAHSIRRRLRAALFMSDDACKSDALAAGTDPRRRVMLLPDGESFRWQLYADSDSGCLQTLRCMLED